MNRRGLEESVAEKQKRGVREQVWMTLPRSKDTACGLIMIAKKGRVRLACLPH